MFVSVKQWVNPIVPNIAIQGKMNGCFLGIRILEQIYGVNIFSLNHNNAYIRLDSITITPR